MAEIIKLTGAAQLHAQALLLKESEPKDGLRVAVIGGGCSGFKYKLGWDNIVESDEVHQYQNGVKIIVDERSALFLINSELEYHDDINESGFKVVNPNATTTCGCGESFS